MSPFELKIFSIIYECGCRLMPILAFAWFFYALLLMIRLDRRFRWWLTVLSFVRSVGENGIRRKLLQWQRANHAKNFRRVQCP